MVKQEIKNKPWALISGGSRGIGFAIANALARRDYNLALVARNEEDLQYAKKKLEAIYPVTIEIFPYDLSEEASILKISSWCIEKELPLKMLCNVTGMGGSTDYLSTSLSDSLHMLRLNTEPAVSLTFHVLPLLKKNQPAYILNVSSMAGFAPISIKNIYSATKSAILFFSYSLRYQLKKDNISVSCLCPGPVFTKPSIEKETIDQLGWFGKHMAIPPEKLGEIAIDKTLKKAMIIVPGFLAKTVSVILRILPKRWIAYIYYKLAS
jgi:uncharacterized protein